MEKNLITRQEAAEIAGVTPQTISNWYKHRYFTARETESGVLQIHKDNFMKFYESCRGEIRDYEEFRKYVASEREKLREELEEIRREKFSYIKPAIYRFLYPHIETILNMLRVLFSNKLNLKENDILKEFLQGADSEDIAKEKGYSRERIRHLLCRCIYRLHDATEEVVKRSDNFEFTKYIGSYEEKTYTIDYLRDCINKQAATIKRLQDKIDAYEFQWNRDKENSYWGNS